MLVKSMEHEFKILPIDISRLHTIQFVEPIDYNVGGIAMFVKNDCKVCEINELKIPYASKVRVEDLWVEVTNNFGEKQIVSLIYRHPGGNVKLFTEHFEKSLSKIENNKSIKRRIIAGNSISTLSKDLLN